MTDSVSRRAALGAGMGSMGMLILPVSAAARSPVGGGGADAEEAIARRYYKLWEVKDWGPFDALLADDFAFTSPNDDDHISKSAFKTKCWDSQIDFIKSFDVEAVLTRPGEAFVKYLCHTKNGKAFRNIEYQRIRDRRIVSIECYFGGQSTFASAVGSRPS